jgi:hypothetical protein
MAARNRLASGLGSIAIAVGAGYACARTGFYGLTLFLVMPMLVGSALTAIVRPASAARGTLLGGAATAAGLLGFYLGGAEGLGCVLMASPLIVLAGAFGGYIVVIARRSGARPRDAALLLLLPPASLTFDVTAKPPLYEVRTTIEIAAPPERVWRNVVAVHELPEPAEWYFRTGLAYPIRARIDGDVRYCDFSTGTFVEPVVIRDEPRLLRFRVTDNPAPMREWSPYGEVNPKHLHGYLVSEQGQFRLTALPGGRTLLEGTSWYRHGLWPAQYWRWWSDAIIHRIHLRVLNHIRNLSETS